MAFFSVNARSGLIFPAESDSATRLSSSQNCHPERRSPRRPESKDLRLLLHFYGLTFAKYINKQFIMPAGLHTSPHIQ
jgi:hypothetical protein